MTVAEPGALDAAADELARAAAQALLTAGLLGLSSERHRAAAQAVRDRERALRKLIIWSAHWELASSELAEARTAEREQSDRVARARQVFEEARASEAAALEEGVDPGLLVDAATRARTAAEIAERQGSALISARQARESAERAVAKAEKRVRRARRELDATEHALAGPGPEGMLLSLLPGRRSGPGGGQ